MKSAIRWILLALLLALVAWIWFRHCGGVTHQELKSAIESESEEIQARIDDRFMKIDKKLDRIEGKLDKLLDMATPKLPDGMKSVW